MRKWAFRMARNVSGASVPGSNFWAVQGGTARTTQSSAPTVSSPSSKASPTARPSANLTARSERPSRMSAPAPRNRSIAGSTKAAARLGEATSGSHVPSALGQGFAHDGAGEVGRGLLRRGVQGRQAAPAAGTSPTGRCRGERSRRCGVPDGASSGSAGRDSRVRACPARGGRHRRSTRAPVRRPGAASSAGPVEDRRSGTRRGRARSSLSRAPMSRR